LAVVGVRREEGFVLRKKAREIPEFYILILTRKQFDSLYLAMIEGIKGLSGGGGCEVYRM